MEHPTLYDVLRKYFRKAAEAAEERERQPGCLRHAALVEAARQDDPSAALSPEAARHLAGCPRCARIVSLFRIELGRERRERRKRSVLLTAGLAFAGMVATLVILLLPRPNGADVKMGAVHYRFADRRVTVRTDPSGHLLPGVEGINQLLAVVPRKEALLIPEARFPDVVRGAPAPADEGPRGLWPNRVALRPAARVRLRWDNDRGIHRYEYRLETAPVGAGVFKLVRQGTTRANRVDLGAIPAGMYRWSLKEERVPGGPAPGRAVFAVLSRAAVERLDAELSAAGADSLLRAWVYYRYGLRHEAAVELAGASREVPAGPLREELAARAGEIDVDQK